MITAAVSSRFLGKQETDKTNFPLPEKHLFSKPGDSRMGCTALSPSFHGNLLLWKLGRWRFGFVERRCGEGGAGGVDRGERWREKKKRGKRKHDEEDKK